MKTKLLLTWLVFVAIAVSAWPPVSDLPVKTVVPDPLKMLDGTPVTSKGQWFDKRKPELKALFQHYMYGFIPNPKEFSTRVELVDKKYLGGKATLKLVTVRFGQPEPRIDLMVITPNHRKNPAPVFLGLNFGGNYACVTNPLVPIPHVPYRGKPFKEAGRAKQLDVWCIERTIDRGYAVAMFLCEDIQPDTAKSTNGAREVFFHCSGTDAPGTLATWAWGLSRAIDYLVTDKNIDKQHIAVVGHSRLGKTAILAAAFDDRIALAIPLQAGTGGTAPSRGNTIESVEQINTRFPHWFDDEFKKFNKEPDRLPFDQNCLIALCAPRPVLISCATDDAYSSASAQFDMLKAADKTYRLAGTDGLAASEMPAVNEPVLSTLGFFLRPGKHSMTQVDWNVFLDFADKHFGKPQ